MSSRVKITDGGQISVPAKVRRRWGSEYLTAEDRGDHLVLRPAAEDPLGAIYGIFAAEAADAPGLDEIREGERRADAANESAKSAGR